MSQPKKHRLGYALQKCYLGLIFFFLYAPILVLMIYSFNASPNRGNWEGFSLRWYQSLLENDEIMTALFNTITIAVLAAIISTIIGTFAALVIYRMRRLPKALVMQATYLPVLNPDIVTGVALMMLFIFTKIPLGYVSLLLAHISFCVPFVILSILPKLEQLKSNLYEAALDLGASPAYAFQKVILPELWPGILTGLIFAFTLSLDDFVVSFFTTGNGVSNLSIVIYAMARKGVSPEVNAVSTIMFVVVLTLLAVVNWRMGKNSQGEEA